MFGLFLWIQVVGSCRQEQFAGTFEISFQGWSWPSARNHIFRDELVHVHMSAVFAPIHPKDASLMSQFPPYLQQVSEQIQMLLNIMSEPPSPEELAARPAAREITKVVALGSTVQTVWICLRS